MIGGRILTRHQWLAGSKSAALAVATIGALLASSCQGVSSPVSGAPAITTSHGEWASFGVGDGWQVVLAPSSALRFPSTTGTGHHRVEFQGEAAFTVTGGAQPLVVQVGSVTAVATMPGTRFVVRAYPGDTLTDVVTVDGVVTAYSHAKSARDIDSMVISSGFRAQATAKGFVSLRPDWPAAGALSAFRPWSPPPRSAKAGVVFDYWYWAENVTFDDAPLSEVASALERWLDVTIDSIPPSLKTKRLTATLQHDPHEPPTEIFQLIAASLGIEVVQVGPRRYILRER